MDVKRVDRISKALAAGTPRRTLLRAVPAATLAMLSFAGSLRADQKVRSYECCPPGEAGEIGVECKQVAGTAKEIKEFEEQTGQECRKTKALREL